MADTVADIAGGGVLNEVIDDDNDEYRRKYDDGERCETISPYSILFSWFGLLIHL